MKGPMELWCGALPQCDCKCSMDWWRWRILQPCSSPNSWRKYRNRDFHVCLSMSHKVLSQEEDGNSEEEMNKVSQVIFIRVMFWCFLKTQGWAKKWTSDCGNFVRQVEAELVSNSRTEIHQTRDPHSSPILHRNPSLQKGFLLPHTEIG